MDFSSTNSLHPMISILIFQDFIYFVGAIRTEERQLNGKLIIDQSEYSVNGALTQNRKSSTWTYKPTLEIVVPGRENIKLDGTIKNEAGKTFDAAVSVNGLSKDAITMQCK